MSLNVFEYVWTPRSKLVPIRDRFSKKNIQSLVQHSDHDKYCLCKACQNTIYYVFSMGMAVIVVLTPMFGRLLYPRSTLFFRF